MKKIMNIVSILLIATILSSMTTFAFAETNSSEIEKTSFADIKGEAGAEARIVKELQEERTEYTKRFLLDDGTKMIAEYQQPVHYQDGKDNWLEYDNTLDSNLKNKSSNFGVDLSERADAKEIVKVISKEYTVSWGFKDAAASNYKQADTEDTKEIGNEKYTTLPNLTSEVTYENVYKNVDLQYIVSPTGVKENIILKDADVQNEFFITYNIGSLRAVQKDDYTITLYDIDNKEVYSIVAPYMTDGKEEISTQLKMSIENSNDGVLEVKLSVDYWFIHGLFRSFPVTIDPQIVSSNNQYCLNLNEAYNNGYLINHGPYYVNNNDIMVAVPSNLYTLEDGEQIVSAKYKFTISNSSSLFANDNENAVVVNAHKITNHSGSSVSYSQDILDYDTVTYSDNKTISFDLTKTYKEWYTEESNKRGFILEARDTAGSKTLNINDSTTRPVLTLIYKDFKGTESSLSYHTYDVGQNATASVSDYLGNLVLNQKLYEGTGSRNPISLSMTYNSINHDELFGNNSESGLGWQLSCNQYIREATSALVSAGYGYIYTDSDGTEHFLKESDEEDSWYDEDTGFSISVGENEITAENGTTQKYYLPANGGKLKSESDSNGNTIQYSYYDNGNIHTITDGTGERSLNFLYSDNQVTFIQLPNGNNIGFGYDCDLLTSITFPGGRTTYLTYNEDDRLDSVKQYSGNTMNGAVNFVYTGEKVTKVTEYGSDNSEGNYIEMTYGNDNTTTFTDKQGRTSTYTFDNYGNKISVLNANGYLENNGGNGFFAPSGADSFTKNYMTNSSQQNASEFMLINGGTSTVVSSGGTFSIDNSAPTQEDGRVQYLGTTSIKVNNPVSSNNAAFFTGAAQQMSVNELNGKTATFSAYVKTKNVAQIYSGGAVGAIVKIKYFLTGGGSAEYNSVGITGTQDWQRLSISTTIPENTAYIRVYCMIRYASGTAWFDCLQLEEGNAVNDFNALQNADFSSNDSWYNEEDNAVSPQNGSVTLNGVAGAYNDIAEQETEVQETTVESTEPATTIVVETEPAEFGNITATDTYGNVVTNERGQITRTVRKTYLVESGTTVPETTEATQTTTAGSSEGDTDPLGNKYIYQNVEVNRMGICFNIVGEAQAKSVPLSNETRTFGIALNIYYDGVNVPETHYQKFNSNTDKKQTVSLSVYPYDNEKIIDHIAFAFVYGYNKNTMTVDNAMLNIASVAVADESGANSGEGELETNQGEEETGNFIDYEVVSESLDTSQEYMRSSAAYTSNGNYTASQTDEAGHTVYYTYDVDGNVTESVDGNGYETQYEYNAAGNVTKLKNGASQNLYSYNGAGTISAIQHNGFQYDFNYDVFGKLISTKIGTVALSSNTYSASGLLTRTTYANGDYIDYSYDDYDRVVQMEDENDVFAQFVYNKKGLVTKYIDALSGITTYYYYDFSGSKTGEYRQTEGGDLSYYLSYDSDGNTVEKTAVGNIVRTIVKGKTENGCSFISNDGVSVSSEIDDFGRLTKVTTANSDNSIVLNNNYFYTFANNTNATSPLIYRIHQSLGTHTFNNYYYLYDGNNNITQINEDSNVSVKYEYDNLNQLSIETDYLNHLYTTYEYDESGNILNAKTYSFTAPTVNELLSEKTYGYDNVWKDKMTSFNGATITYDNAGNPLTYRDNISFSWSRGRILDKVTVNNADIQMHYDSNGMRTQKGSTYYYYDSNNNLIALKKGESTLFFYYDSNNSPTSFSYNGIMHYYIKNLQGDIIKIINQNAETIASYSYNAWGEIIYIKNYYGAMVTDSGHLGMLNPFRYRGYVYDDETGLYYLRTRYYDPKTMRFINSDSAQFIVSTKNVLSCNAYAYCANNPVRFVDHDGTVFFDLLALLASNISLAAGTYFPMIHTGAMLISALNSLHETLPMSVEFYLLSYINRCRDYQFDFSNNNMYINKILNSSAFDRIFMYSEDAYGSEFYEDYLELVKNKYHGSFLAARVEGFCHSCIQHWVVTGTFNPYASHLQELDLKMSIGGCTATVYFDFLGNGTAPRTCRWRLTVYLIDRYDYEYKSYFENNIFIAAMNNGPGLCSQLYGVAIPYKWIIQFTYIYEHTVVYGG